MSMLSGRTALAALAVVLFGLSPLAGCSGGGGQEAAPAPSGTQAGGPAEPVVITIGNLTDLTGVSTDAMSVVDMALDDTVRYANENNLIPGVELKVIKYDTQADRARDIPGYEWLRQSGADVIWSGLPWTAASLKERAEEDGMVVFTPTASLDDLAPPGWIFCAGVVPEIDAYTLLSWVAENDWDWAANGPATIGGAGWQDSYSPPLLSAAKEYCQAHPDRFKWVGSHLTNFSFAWGPEAEALKDADYVLAPLVMTNFVTQYRDLGGRGKMLCGDPQVAFMGSIADADLWDELDGMLAVRASRWWNEEGELIDLTRDLLRRYHPDAADEVMRRGSGYLGVSQAYQVIQCIKTAVKNVGAEDFDPEALYQATERFTLTVDGTELYGFTPEKRSANNYCGIYELRAEGADLFRAQDAWYPEHLEP